MEIEEELDKNELNKTIINKLKKRETILRDNISMETPKTYKLDRGTKKFKEYNFRKDSKDKVKGNRRSNYRSNSRQLECPNCIIDGLYVINPFYKIDYLNNFYDMLELTYYSHRDDPTFVHALNNRVAIMFNNLNLYQLIEYSHQLNPTLSAYLFRFIVDALYLLKIPENFITNFYLGSRLIIVRYEKGANIMPYISDIRNASSAIVTMSIGPGMNVYDIVPVNYGNDRYRFFFKNGSILLLDGQAKESWVQVVPKNFVYTDVYRYELILLAYTNKVWNFILP